MKGRNNNLELGTRLYRDGQYERAGQVMQETLKRLGPKDHNRLSTENNIGSVYFMQRRYGDAKYVFEHTLQKMEQQDHPDTLTCKRNLAWTYAMLGDIHRVEVLICQLLATSEEKQSPKNHNHRKRVMMEERSILEELSQMRERASLVSSSGLGKAWTSRVKWFRLFPQLPGEIRNLIWEFAAVHAVKLPKHITLFMQGNEIRTVSTQNQDLALTCKDGYTIYSRHYSRHNQDFVVYGEQNHRLAVNFASDIFHITGRIDQLDHHLRNQFTSFQRIALHETISNVSGFLHYLPELQELWVLFGYLNEFNLLSVQDCQQVWSAHHCDKFPDDYISSNSYAKDRTPCPVCHWRCGFGDLPDADIAPRFDHAFILTYSALLPVLPSADQIKRSTKPMLRWIRRGTFDMLDPSSNLFHGQRRREFRNVALEYFQRKDVYVTSEVIQGLID